MELKLVALKAFNWVWVGMTVLFVAGLYTGAEVYFTQANLVVKCLVAAWLIYRFYFHQKVDFTKFDRSACVTAGGYILVGSIADLVNLYMNVYRSTIKRM
jgi:hypothetical protein